MYFGIAVLRLLLQQFDCPPPPDPIIVAKVLTQLAQLLERDGQQQRACDLYERVVASDSAPVAAAVNQGNWYASRGHMEKAIPVWKAALARSPGLEAARLNLAVAQYRTGDVAAARATLSEGAAIQSGVDPGPGAID